MTYKQASPRIPHIVYVELRERFIYPHATALSLLPYGNQTGLIFILFLNFASKTNFPHRLRQNTLHSWKKLAPKKKDKK